MPINWDAVAAVASSVAALGGIVAAIIAGHALKPTKRAARAQERSAGAAEELYRIEIERGHHVLAPDIELDFTNTEDDVYVFDLFNKTWRQYRVEIMWIAPNGPLGFGPAEIFAAPNPEKPSFGVLFGRRRLELRVPEYARELLIRYGALVDWSCPCSRAAGVGHWFEFATLPLIPRTPR